MRQILSNLLANSLDACASGSTIRIEASSARDPRDLSRQGVRITIADTGLGIPARHLESIFEPFFTTKKDTGTGLGLWVSRELVEKHGGSLRVRSRTSAPFCGTVFSIFLPNRGGLHAIDSLSTNDHAPTTPRPVNNLSREQHLAQSVDAGHSLCCLNRMDINDSLRLPDPPFYDIGRLHLPVLVQKLRIAP